jgi:hypothetical protein
MADLIFGKYRSFQEAEEGITNLLGAERITLQTLREQLATVEKKRGDCFDLIDILHKGDDDRSQRVIDEEIRRYTAYLSQTARTPELISGKILQVEKRVTAREKELASIDRVKMRRDRKVQDLKNSVGRTPESPSSYEKFLGLQ